MGVHPAGARERRQTRNALDAFGYATITVRLADGCLMWQTPLARELLEWGAQHAHTAAIKEVLFHQNFPVDIRHNSKIYREALAAWATRELG